MLGRDLTTLDWGSVPAESSSSHPQSFSWELGAAATATAGNVISWAAVMIELD